MGQKDLRDAVLIAYSMGSIEAGRYSGTYHGDADASAPLPITGVRITKLIKNSDLIVYPGAPHGLPITHRGKSIADILGVIRN